MVDLRLGWRAGSLRHDDLPTPAGEIAMYREVRVVNVDEPEHAAPLLDQPNDPFFDSFRAIEAAALHNRQHPACEPLLQRVLTDQQPIRLADAHTVEAGVDRWWEITLRPVSHDRVVCMWRDITEQAAAPRALAADVSQLTNDPALAPAGTLRVDRQGNVLFATATCVELFDTQAPIPVGDSLLDYVHPDQRRHIQRALIDCIAEDHEVAVQFRRMPGGDDDTTQTGGAVWLEALLEMVRGTNDEPMVHVSVRDVTDERNSLDRDVFGAHFDELTGLHNPRGFDERLSQLPFATATSPTFAAIIIGLDDVAAIKNRWGDDVGDELLLLVGRRIRDALRTNDFAARLSDDEFGVVAFAKSDTAVLFARQLRLAVEQPYDVAGQSLTIGASVGLAHRDSSVSVDEMLAHASLAMHRYRRQRNTANAALATFTPAVERADSHHDADPSDTQMVATTGVQHPVDGVAE